MEPVFTPDQMLKLKSSFDTMHSKYAKQILEDQGSGSIFENILQINDYISKRLNAKVDLTRDDQIEEGTKAAQIAIRV